VCMGIATARKESATEETPQRDQKPPRDPFHHSDLRRGEPLLRGHLHRHVHPLSLAIDPTCTIDLITIGGIVRLFYIDHKIFLLCL
jgi:hypothetical protein